MKTTGIALGVTGSFVSLYLGVLTLNVEAIMEYPGLKDALNCDHIIEFIVTWKPALAALLFVSAAFGAAGSLALSRRGLVSGIMFIAAAICGIISIGGIPSGICFIVAGIFAFIKKNQPDPAPAEDDSCDDLGL